MDEGEKEEFRYLLRKSEYFPPRNIKSINQVNNEALELTININDNKNIKNMNQEKDKSVLNKTKIQKFWDWFKASETALVNQYGEDLENMGAAIFEKFTRTGTESILGLEMKDNDKYILTITAEGIKDLITEILEIIQYAPSLIDEIEFHVLKDKNNQIKFSELHNYLQ